MTASPGLVVDGVTPGSAAEAAGIVVGTRILSINGAPVRDVLELYFRESEGRLVVETEDSAGAKRRVRVDKLPEDPLGLSLAPTRDLVCREQCVFCFVHQNPRGLRRSLYFKDDDYRLSFLHGNFVTLTHAPPGALQRIVEQRISPIYVSVHATDPELRGRLLGNRGPAPILPILEELARGEITFFGQIVLCPGWNDGTVLERTLEDMAHLHPHCPALAVVPLGLTEHRARLPSMRPFEAADAVDCLRALRPLQRGFRQRLGTTFAFAADEIYLRAGRLPPSVKHYEGFPMLEDGVGMWRAFNDGFRRRVRRQRRATSPGRRIVVATGQLFAPTLRALAADLAASAGAPIEVVAVENRLFGATITVAGLLSGRCLIHALASVGLRPGDVVLLPGNMWNDAGVALDDTTPADIEQRLGVRVVVAGRTAAEFFQCWGRLAAEPQVTTGRSA